MMPVYYSTELYHHGILGQKWGIRRYQNEDGSLTEAGRKRYQKLTNQIEKQAAKVTRLKSKALKVQFKQGRVASKYLQKAGRHQRKAHALISPFRPIHEWRYEVDMGKSREAQGKIDTVKAKSQKAESFLESLLKEKAKLNTVETSKGKAYVSRFDAENLNTYDLFYYDNNGKIIKQAYYKNRPFN